MTLRINTLTIRVLSLLFIASIILQACHGPASRDRSRPDADKKVTLSVRAFKSDVSNTWGYEILINNKVYIHQEHIPALEGKQPFKSKSDALKVGRVIMQKIKNHQSPTLSREEVLALLDMKN